MNTNNFIKKDMAAGLAFHDTYNIGLTDTLFDMNLSNYAKLLMDERLLIAHEQGKCSWWNKEECSTEHLKALLLKNITDHDMVDVMVLAAMIHVRQLTDSSNKSDSNNSNSYKNIKRIINNIISREGGFVDHPNDRGGATKYGITKGSLTHYLGREAKTSDIKNVTKNDAFEIYYQQYYRHPKIDQLPEYLQEIMLDMAVNHGAKSAIKILQTVLVSYGFMIEIDGIIGNKTLNTITDVIESIGWPALMNELIDARVQFYEKIVKSDNTQRVFLSGWINRAESFRDVA